MRSPSARQSAFVADVPGTYEITLTVGNGTAAPSVARKAVTIGNRAPVPTNDLYGLDVTSSIVLRGSVLAGVHQDSDPDGDALTAMLARSHRATAA